MDPPDVFVSALLSLRDARLDPALTVVEVPAPSRIAPWSAALEVKTSEVHREKPLGVGTLVILFDPEQEDRWGSPFRLVGHAHMQIDAEQSTDPLLGEAIWKTLSISLDQAGAGFFGMIGSVTREITESFGGLELRGSALGADLRCSWSPVSEFLTEHLEGWADTLRQNSGIEPSGVTTLRPSNA